MEVIHIIILDTLWKCLYSMYISAPKLNNKCVNKHIDINKFGIHVSLQLQVHFVYNGCKAI